MNLTKISEFFNSIDGKLLKKQLYLWTALLLVCIALQLLNLDLNTDIFMYLNSSKYSENYSIWSTLTLLGDTGILWPMMLIFCLTFMKSVYAVLAAVPVGGLLSWTLKRLFDEPRPAAVIPLDDIHIIGPILKTHGFPSGHSITIFAAVSVIYMTCTLKNNIFNLLFKATILLLGSMVVISRVMVGAHWPIDCLAGVCIGWISGLSGVFVVKYFHNRLQSFKLEITIISLLWLMGISNLFREFEYPNSITVVLASLLVSTLFFLSFNFINKRSIASFFP